jgi:DNA polymerase-3 subunit delta'
LNLVAATEMARAGRLYPAVILHGGTAELRQSAAVETARLLLCAAGQEKRPCGRCPHCRRIVWPGGQEEPFHPDFRVLQRDLKTATSVAATRAFLLEAQVAPFEAGGQVFVIASADTLSGEAGDALLKTLEEPHIRAPRNFLLLAPSQFDLRSTIRSRSLAVYLGSVQTLDEERIEKLTRGFSDCLERFDESGGSAQLLGAAEVLASAGPWEDPRAAQPWSRAAAAVLLCAKTAASGAARRRQLLALAEDLLGGAQLRLRGIVAQRILEGLVVDRLAGRRLRGSILPDI